MTLNSFLPSDQTPAAKKRRKRKKKKKKKKKKGRLGGGAATKEIWYRNPEAGRSWTVWPARSEVRKGSWVRRGRQGRKHRPEEA